NATYVVESVLGEGGMGRVYRASHTRILSKQFAIKVLRPEFTRNVEVVARFRREAEAAACISHPNVVEVYDVDETDDGYSYLVCEYLAGLDLSEFLGKQSCLSSLAAVNLGLQLCRALEAAHQAGVIHRDIKPHNVFLLASEDGSLPEYPAVKMLDFGLSRFMDADGTQLTRAGVIMGTPSYMSPEQAEGKVVDARTDVYGLGAVLFAALTGRPPYEADTLQALVLAVVNQEPARPRSINPQIPENLELIVQRAMARVPEERYQSMAEFRSALEAYYDRVMAESLSRAAPPRPAALSMVQEQFDENVATARPRLLAYAATLTLLLAFGLFSSISSIELWTGRWRLSKHEALLLMFGVVGTLLTPALLWLGRFRKSIWTSHSKVLLLLARLRAAVIFGLVAYGLAALSLRILDDVVGRFTQTSLLGTASGSGFRGFNLILVLIALTWVLHHLVRPMSDRRMVSNKRQLALGIACLSVSVGFIYAGLRWRVHQGAVEAAATAMDKATEQQRWMNESHLNKTPIPSTAPIDTQPPPRVEHATLEELAAANTKGIPGLLPLSERYPKDPEVLRPLLYNFASRATSLAEAMDVAGHLLDVSPEDARDPDLRYLVKKAATSPGQASRIAFGLMTDHMGTTGPDLLYDLYVSEPKVSAKAEKSLSNPNLQAHFSAALSVAFALRKINSCAGRVPLLERAAALGDRRSVAILSPLSASSKHGCGRWKRSPCLPVCPEEARAYMQTINKILERQPNPR
ncbi:MAG TPA: serine/threonine-protein kinase, partial [Polyangiaceae bacterium]